MSNMFRFISIISNSLLCVLFCQALFVCTVLSGVHRNSKGYIMNDDIIKTTSRITNAIMVKKGNTSFEGNCCNNQCVPTITSVRTVATIRSNNYLGTPCRNVFDRRD